MTDKQDDDVQVFLDEMRTMSDFVYDFANMRNIVRNTRGKKTGKYLWFFGEEKEHQYETDALILTQKGAQDKNENAYLKYPITPDAILKFLSLNRKWFVEPSAGAYLVFDETGEEKEPLGLEDKIKELQKENFKIVDYDDKYSTAAGGLVYAVILNLTQKWVSVVFRGTVGFTDINTDRDFRLNTTSFFESEDFIFVDGNTPGTHNGFTDYLFSSRSSDSTDRPYVDRILACINDQFGSNEVVGDDWKLYVSGHSLGGGLANLFGFRVAQLKAKGDPRVSNLPPRVKVMSYAAPCVGDEGYDKECQYLEDRNILRHIRISNEGDIVPTNNIPVPFSLAMMGDTSLYKQNGVNIFLKPEDKMDIAYGNTKPMWPQFSTSAGSIHGLVEYQIRMELDENKEDFNQTVEELYKKYKPASASTI